MENNSNASESSIEIGCSAIPPSTQELFANLPPGGYVMYSFLFLFFLLTLAIYIEEIVFVLKNFKISMRKKKTIWILGFHTVFSGCGLVGCIVPRSGTLIDMVSNLFFGTCLYNFGRLLINYMGGGDKIWQLVGPDRMIPLHTPPCLCCCPCIPPAKLTRSVFFRISLAIMQVAIVRPIIMFFAAVLWTNGSYAPGQMDGTGFYLYFTIVNTISSLIAVYGLMLLRGAFRPELERDFHITGKIFSVQLAIIISAIPNLILSILVTTNVIPCGPIFPSEARAEAIYHTILVMVMFPFSLLARYFFRRVYDGYGYAGDQRKTIGAVVSAAASAAAAASLAVDLSQHVLLQNGQVNEEDVEYGNYDDDLDGDKYKYGGGQREEEENDEDEEGEEEEFTGSSGDEFEEDDTLPQKPAFKWPSETNV